jgi:hypothetical protein
MNFNMDLFKIILFSLLVLIISCKTDSRTENQVQKHYIIAKSVPVSEMMNKIPQLAEYSGLMMASLQKRPPVLLLADEELTDPRQRKAQDIAISDKEFTRDVFHRESGVALRNEIMSVREAKPDEIPPDVQCVAGDCYRVLMYNYYSNSTTIALVDIGKGKAASIKHLIDSEAEINKRLYNIAVDIALNSPEVIQILEIDPTDIVAAKNSLRITMNSTKCERSKHLCVGPVFYNKNNNRTVWSIVDLTDWKLTGLAWSEKSDIDQKITEMELQNEFVMAHFCEKTCDTAFGNWKLNYRIVGSDGLEVFDVKYMDKVVIRSSKIVDWHVSYLNKPGVGYSDATGCPMFSAAAVVAFNGPYLEKIEEPKGFAFVQDFRSPIWPAMCNYRYQSRFEFYDDGSFRIMGVNHGKGCNDSAVYKPVFRMDIEVGDGPENFAMWNGNAWQKWDKEQWSDQKIAKLTREGYWMKLTNDQGEGYYIEPDYGQYGKKGRGDAAFVYVSKYHDDKDEGVTDMVTIGDCCSYNYKQGPEKFLEPAENLDKSKLILWYVPRMYNDKRAGLEYCWAKMDASEGKLEVRTWPGTVGPKFIPISK